MNETTHPVHPEENVVARVNGIAITRPGETLGKEALRQRACTELLRQAAQQAGLLAADDRPDDQGVISEAADEAIDALMARELRAPPPSEADCRRFFDANPARFRRDERVKLRHILFAVTPGVDVNALRTRAEGVLIDVRCHDGSAADSFAESARKLSNCPSGAEGGHLGWLGRQDCVEEFSREVFGGEVIGVLPRLVSTRFGWHVIEVLERDAGVVPRYEEVAGAVSRALERQSFATALRQYLSLLAAEASLVGVSLESAESPLVQ